MSNTASRRLVCYIHGKGGSASERAHYAPLFPDRAVIGLTYRGATPWETGREIREAVRRWRERYAEIVLIANSIGAYFSMNAGIGAMLREAYFISPIVDMERLIGDMMGWSHVTEAELQAKGVIQTEFGEELSWDYLRYVRSHPIEWDVPTHILYGENDALTSPETVRRFAARHGADLTVMRGGEHWFRTEKQMRVVDDWIRGSAAPGG